MQNREIAPLSEEEKAHVQEIVDRVQGKGVYRILGRRSKNESPADIWGKYSQKISREEVIRVLTVEGETYILARQRRPGDNDQHLQAL